MKIALSLIEDFPEKKIAVLSIDPSKRKTGGALLGDRIRMNSSFHPRVYMRSFATREANVAMNKSIKNTIEIMKSVTFHPLQIFPRVSSYAKIYREEKRESKPREKR